MIEDSNSVVIGYELIYFSCLFRFRERLREIECECESNVGRWYVYFYNFCV